MTLHGWSLVGLVVSLAVCQVGASSYTLQTSNPYSLGNELYVNPTWAAKVVAAAASHTDLYCEYLKVSTYPSFIWIDKISMISKLNTYMDDAKANDQMIQIIIYDLPNRDCAAAASNGELTVDNNGLATYKSDYIDAIATVLNNHSTVPVVMIIEPDSLPNLVTNLATTKCAAANYSYMHGVAYAISKLAASNRYMYIDIGHECWLGWTSNQNGWITVLKSVLSLVTDTTSLRGFASNTANYQNVHKASSYSGCGDGNTIYDDATYVETMSALMYNQGVFATYPYFIIDTGRNGADDPRSDTSQWCNIKNTGIGKRPALGSTDSAVNYVDAFVWAKPPGESDGTSNTSATRYDYHCTSTDSLTPAPEAGEWFDNHFLALVENAVPAVSCSDSDSATATTTTSTSSALPGQTSNPYEKYTDIFRDPVWQAQVDTAIAAHPTKACQYENVKNNPSFIWLDKIAMLDKLPTYMASAKTNGQMIQLVIYDLPNRDCAAAASNGELTVNSTSLSIYKTKYIDAIDAILDTYSSVPVVMIIEPDSLPNLVTNTGVAKCANATTQYKQGVAYAISKLAASNRYMYIDIGHECWLGWTSNQKGWLTVIASVFDLVTDTTSVRGFASNTANYQNVHEATGYVGCGGGNTIYDDATYVKTMSALMYKNGIFSSYPQFIIDTGRNGADDPRTDTSQWCNIKNTGIGKRPALGSSDSDVSYVDAFTWSKPPGQSDGTSDSTATRYDYHCGSNQSLSGAPEAGEWFDAHFVTLVEKAVPSFSTECSSSSSPAQTVTVSSEAGTTTNSGVVTAINVLALFALAATRLL